uniref:mucin-5AC-like n=1 Tax=Styela clava TaxID=7725 RepID=UPI00193A7EAE|nr:mucin-5AC-like [Styela clava]
MIPVRECFTPFDWCYLSVIIKEKDISCGKGKKMGFFLKIAVSAFLLVINLVFTHAEVCSSTATRYNCIQNGVITQQNCNDNYPTCLWCPDIDQNSRKCQTANLACKVPDRKVVTTFTSQTTCEAAGHVYCNGAVTQQCVEDEPIRKWCYAKNSEKTLVSCPTTHTNEADCQSNNCFWCGPDARGTKQNTCFAIPSDVTCPNTASGTCCPAYSCLKNTITEATCTAKGCNYCPDDNLCVLGEGGPTAPPPSANCNANGRFNCIQNGDVTIENCKNSWPNCNWCTGQTTSKLCQTEFLDCKVSDRKVVTGLTKTQCLAANHIYCDGDYSQQCIQPEPIRKYCYSKGSEKTLTTCPYTNEVACHNGGCFWCGEDSRGVRRNMCFQIPSEVMCPSGGTCCQDYQCLRNGATSGTCASKGCHYCNNEMLCVFGGPVTTTPPTTTTPTTTTPTTTTPTTTTPTTTTPTTTTPTTTTPTTTTPTTTTPTTTTPTTTTPTTTTPTTTTPTTTMATTTQPACPTANVEDCLSTPVTNAQLCVDLGCEWCMMNNMMTCKRAQYASTCNAPTGLSVCNPPPWLTSTPPGSCPTCKSHGCEWCGDSSSNIECPASTGCSTCDCQDPQPCAGANMAACVHNGCLWCNTPTVNGGYNCINVDAHGLLPGNANQWTACSRSCGGGTRFRYTPTCTTITTNPYACTKEYETCNAVACPLGDVCPQGVGVRYDDTKTCCMSQSTSCGMNILNRLPVEGCPTKRKKRSIEEEEDYAHHRVKRIIGGAEIDCIDKWPWLVVIYVGSTIKCTGVIVSTSHVLTYKDCLGATLPAEGDIAVHADTYDRALDPGLALSVAVGGILVEPTDSLLALLEV